ncbi:Lysozyme RrrD [Carnimonas sp. R-84981]|uniref:lysozyme n=1 Tax=Carnimonas bestiolae TaxID=3402172 RepID=UPI003EDC750B
MTNMKASTRALSLIEAFEGLNFDAYPDPGSGAQPWTIGYGHTRGVRHGDRATPRQIVGYLQMDIANAEHNVNRYVSVDITQNQFDALIDFVFNLGAGNFSTSTLLKKLNAGDIEGAASEFPRWVHSGGKVMSGLVSRRHAEQSLFMRPQNSPSPAINWTDVAIDITRKEHG